jgi:V8-like Glu-specific endopeptidase
MNLKVNQFIALIFTLLAKVSFGFSFIDSNNVESPFNSLRNISEAPNFIKLKSSAIFQLGGGTGSFVSYSGKTYVMTNNHIVGPGNCALSGCYVEAFFNLEAGKQVKKTVLFLTPVATDQDIDVSFFEFQEALDDGTLMPFQAESTLSFKKLEKPRDLLKSKVYVVGHPRLGLKKFSVGNIIRLENGHIVVSAFTLPGNSGSPILTEDGNILGIHHSSVKRNDNITKVSSLHEGKASSVFSLEIVLKNSIESNLSTKDQFVSIHQKFSYSRAKKITPVFLATRVVPVLDSGKSFFNELYQECRDSINLSATSAATFATSHEACTIARSWLGCQNLETRATSAFTLSNAKTVDHPDFIETGSWCPSSEIRRDWSRLFIQIGHKYETFVGQSSIPWSADAIFQGFTDRKRGMKAAFEETKLKIEQRNEPVRFDDILSLLRYSEFEGNPSLKKMALVEMVKQYKRLYNYQYEILEIGESVILLVSQGRISRDMGKSIIKQLLSDENITLNAYLVLERKAFTDFLL